MSEAPITFDFAQAEVRVLAVIAETRDRLLAALAANRRTALRWQLSGAGWWCEVFDRRYEVFSRPYRPRGTPPAWVAMLDGTVSLGDAVPSVEAAKALCVDHAEWIARRLLAEG